MNQNLVDSIYGKSSIKIAHFVSAVNTLCCHRNFLHLVGQFLKKSFPLGSEIAWTINQNFVGSIYGRSSIDSAYFVLIRWQTWPPYQHRQFLFLVGRFFKIFSSATNWPNKVKFYRKHLWKVLYKISLFYPSWTKNMVAMGNSVSDWLKYWKQSSPLKLGGIGWNIENNLLPWN